MPDSLSPEEVTALEHSSEGCTHENFYRALATIHDRERERDEAISRGNKVASDVGNLLGTQLNAVTAERDELQRKLDAYQKLAASVWPRSGTALDFESEIAYIEELDSKKEKLAAPVREGEGGNG